MTGKPILVYLLVVVALLSSSVCGKEPAGEARARALEELESGCLVRVVCADLGPVGGRFIKSEFDTLYLGVDENVASGDRPSRRIMRKSKPRTAEPVFKSVEQDTRIAIGSVREIQVRRRATFTGTVVGGAIGGLGGLIVGGIASAIDDRATGTPGAEIAGIAAAGVLAGGMIGTVVGSMFHRWSVMFREPGFRGDADFHPVLMVSTGGGRPDAATLWAGIRVTW